MCQFDLTGNYKAKARIFIALFVLLAKIGQEFFAHMGQMVFNELLNLVSSDKALVCM